MEGHRRNHSLHSFDNEIYNIFAYIRDRSEWMTYVAIPLPILICYLVGRQPQSELFYNTKNTLKHVGFIVRVDKCIIISEFPSNPLR